MIKPTVLDPNSLSYSKGWSYHNQLGTLETESPHVLPKEKSLPEGVQDCFEQEITRAGFQPWVNHAASYLYRAHPGPGWSRDGVQGLADGFAKGWVTGSIGELPVPKSHIPRKYRVEAPATGHPLQTMKTLFVNRDLAVGVSTGSQAMPCFFRNADGDDLFYVQQGTGCLETELGVLGYEPGHFLWIPKGIAYRWVPQEGPHFLFHMENYGEAFQKPDASFTGDSAVYYHRNIEVPKASYVLEEGDFETVIKSNGMFTSYRFPFHPMDVIGWDGTLFPFRLHIRDVKPITSWRAHIPPSAYCLFCGNGFEYCAFVPRPVETAPRSLPVPFDHINIDRDEVIFYSSGVFFSKKESQEGTLTFHPRGPSHGPHPSSTRRALERREKDGAFELEGYSIMVETSRPLFPSANAAALEDSGYINSWQ